MPEHGLWSSYRQRSSSTGLLGLSTRALYTRLLEYQVRSGRQLQEHASYTALMLEIWIHGSVSSMNNTGLSSASLPMRLFVVIHERFPKFTPSRSLLRRRSGTMRGAPLACLVGEICMYARGKLKMEGLIDPIPHVTQLQGIMRTDLTHIQVHKQIRGRPRCVSKTRRSRVLTKQRP
jgi:hypothetical protein